MKKKIIAASTRLFAAALTGILLLVLCLNIGTLAAIGSIRRGEAVNKGYFCAIVGSGSMEPTVRVNDWLLIKGADTYRAEDIVTYVAPGGALVTHRIKAVTEGGYITQGDANNIPDGEIAQARVLGKVAFVLPGIGAIAGGLRAPAGILLLVCLYLMGWMIHGLITAGNTNESKSENESKNESENENKQEEAVDEKNLFYDFSDYWY